MLTEIVLLVVIILLTAVNAAQGYLLYRLSSTVSLLRAAPDVKSATTLIKASQPRREGTLGTEGTYPREVSPSEISEKGIANLRHLQDAAF